MTTKAPEKNIGTKNVTPSRLAKKRPPKNPNRIKTIVDMSEYKNRLRASNREALAKAREY